MLRKRWLKWAAICIGILLLAAGTARSIRVKRTLAVLHKVEMEDMQPYSAAVARQEHLAPQHMAAHMQWTDARKASASDAIRAQRIVATLREGLEPYRDYKAAVRAGYFPFAPDVPQRMYHFTHGGRALRNAFGFDPARPTSLLYKKTERGLELIGAMYTAPRHFSEDRLDQRVPLSMGRWHQHVNICLPARGTPRDQADWSRFGPNGAIATAQDCADAGGRWQPRLFGWMIHVYPYEASHEKIWTH
jgi:hypothetical protein